MNKRGDISNILVFIITFALVVIAILNFASFSKSNLNDSIAKQKVMRDVSFNEQYVLSSAKEIAKESIISGGSDLRIQFIQIAEKKYLGSPSGGNFFGIIRSGEFNFVDEGEFIVLTFAKPVDVSASNGFDRVVRTFEICMKFDKMGAFKGNCEP